MLQQNFPRTQTCRRPDTWNNCWSPIQTTCFYNTPLAKACVNEGDVERGLLKFQAVIDRHPEYVPAYFQKGQALAERGRTDEARAS